VCECADPEAENMPPFGQRRGMGWSRLLKLLLALLVVPAEVFTSFGSGRVVQESMWKAPEAYRW